MEKNETRVTDEKASLRQLTEEESGQVSGGLPLGRMSSLTCKACGATFEDAGAYFEHRKMVHGAS